MPHLCQQHRQPLQQNPAKPWPPTVQVHGKADAHDAKRALLWCNVPNVHPMLVSCGDPSTFLDVRSVSSREVSVGGTEEACIKEAFEVAGEWLQVDPPPPSPNLTPPFLPRPWVSSHPPYRHTHNPHLPL